MKLTAIFILSACLTVAAKTFSQKVTLSVKNAGLEKVFSEIKKQTGYVFFYNESLLEKADKVTLDIKDMPLVTALDMCFEKQPLTYSIVGNNIVIKQKIQVTPVIPEAVPQVNISGQVTDKDGKPLEGANIIVKGTKLGTSSDKNGVFVLAGVDPSNEIVISYTGFISQTLKVGARTSFMIKLGLSDNPMDQVQVIAYGTQSKKFNVGNVTTITAKDIERQPVNNSLLALEGMVPGLYVSQTTGLPGAGVKVNIQGRNSINLGTNPLYVIDGIPYISQLLFSTLNNMLGSSGDPIFGVGFTYGSPLNYINPGDIESISILKDADATAIYGSRAANGAILITTKKGKAGDVRVGVNVRQGWGKVAHFVPMMNTQQYLQMRREGIKNEGLSVSASDYDINGTWDTTRNTDWQKEFIGRTAQFNDYSTSISGGGLNLQYLFGAGFHRETSVFPGDFNDQKINLHFNINSQSANRKFKIQLTGSYMFDNNQLPGTDLTSSALTFAPDAPSLYKTDGSLNFQQLPSGAATFSNPLIYLYRPYRSKGYNLIANSSFTYNLLPGLDISTDLGYTNLRTDEIARTFLAGNSPSTQAFGAAARNAGYNNNSIFGWQAEPQLHFKRKLYKGLIDLLAGTTINQTFSSGISFSGNGYNSDHLLEDPRSAASITITNSIQRDYKYAAAFARLNYNWDDKYIINYNIRRDGTSRFGPENKFHNFSSIGAGWIFSEEKLIRENLPFLSFGKIKASYGTTGSDQLADYQYLNLYSAYNVPVNYQSSVGFVTTGLPNPYLQWEETKKLQAGLDLGFFSNKILFSATFGRNRSSNQLIGFNVPVTTGFTTTNINSPATVQNISEEFTLQTKNIDSKNFKWTSSFNITFPKNKLIAYDGPLPSYLTIGNSISQIKLFHFLGVNPQTGSYVFADSKGNPTATPNSATDFSSSVDPGTPKFYGGLLNSLSYKGFSLDIMLQFVKQIRQNYYYGGGGVVSPGFSQQNAPVYLLNRWQKPGDIAIVQRYSNNFSLIGALINLTSSDARYSDASFVRLKNLSLSYDFEEKLLKRIRFQNLKIYMQAQNLLTVTHYKGLDPESGTAGLPPLRIITLGVQISL